MEIKNMSVEQIEARKAEIGVECTTEGADLDALQEELRKLNEELESRKAAEAKREEIRRAVAAGAGKTVTTPVEQDKTPTLDEIRSSAEYVNAYAEYIKSGDPRECRALLTTNVTNGTIPVPTLVDTIVRTAWDDEEILSRVRRTFFRGNLKVPFERSGDPAYIHVEGTSAPTEESLSIGIKELKPANIKKYIRITDEVAAMGGEEFLRYIYDELTYRIVKKLADSIVDDISGLSTSDSATAPAAAKITAAPSVTVIPTAYANLSDEARDPVIIMNKLTYANFITAQAAGNFAIDPFMGLPVLFNNELPAYDTATTGDVYAIVGDLGGAQANYPEGDGVVIKYDDLTEAESDLIKIVGRQYVAFGVTANGRFTNIAKPAPATT